MERNIRPRVAIGREIRQREAECFVLAGTKFHSKIQFTEIIYGRCGITQLHDRGDQSESCNHNATATAFDIQIHWSRWVDSPEFVGLIGKTNIVRTAIVADISEG